LLSSGEVFFSVDFVRCDVSYDVYATFQETVAAVVKLSAQTHDHAVECVR